MENYDSNQFKVSLTQYSGPLDVLLDLAKSQKVNLENISITKLADQFHEFITKAKNINLEIASEYLLMATWLAYLKSKLLLPESDEEEFKALEIASEYLLMATWLAYLKSKLLLPESDEEEFKALEVAEKLKLQLKKLELIRLLSDQMLKRKRLGKDVYMRGMKGRIKSIYNSTYSLTLYELLKSYASIIMTKDFQRINIPRLPVFTTEDGIKTIKNFITSLTSWKNIEDFIPKNFKSEKSSKRTGKAGIFAGSLELVKEGNLIIKQEKLFSDIFIKQKNE